MPLRDYVRSRLRGDERPLCSTHEADTIATTGAARRADAERDRLLTEAARISLAMGDARADLKTPKPPTADIRSIITAALTAPSKDEQRAPATTSTPAGASFALNDDTSIAAVIGAALTPGGGPA